MAGLKFDPQMDPTEGWRKWSDEYLRLTGNTWDNEAAQRARKNKKYFADQLKARGKKPVPIEEEGKEPEEKINQRKYKKPWPGWEKVVEKL